MLLEHVQLLTTRHGRCGHACAITQATRRHEMNDSKIELPKGSTALACLAKPGHTHNLTALDRDQN